MNTRPLGTSGVLVSEVGLGGYELGGGDSAHGEPSVEQAASAVLAACETGINWLDTAEIYSDTRNEALIGEVLHSVGGELLLSSKVGPAPIGTGFRPEQVLDACRKSLKRLDRERIDIYFMHWRDDTGIPPEETWGVLAQLSNDGLVGAIGLSNHDQQTVERCHVERKVDVVQTGVSLIDRLDNRDAIRRCGELGIGVVTYEPLACGILTGQPLEDVQRVWGADPGTWGSYYQRLLGPGSVDRTAAVVARLGRIAERLAMPIPQLAISWVLHQQGVTAAIAGSRSPGHIKQNAEAAGVFLPTNVLDELEALVPLGPTTGTSDEAATASG